MARGEIHIQLNVDFSDDPKVRVLARYGRDARSIRDLYVQMLCYAKRTLSDGHVPAEQLGILTYPDSPARSKRDADRLVEVGLIKVVDGGWYVPAYLKRNKSRAQVQAAVEDKADRTARAATIGNHRRWHELRGKLDLQGCVHCREAIARRDRWAIAASDSLGSGSDRTETETQSQTETQTETGLDSSPKNPPPPNPPSPDGDPPAEAHATRRDALVAEVQRVRPEWQASSIHRVLNDPKLTNALWPQLERALLAVAADPATQGPGRVLYDGPWWSQQPPPQQPSPRCGQCSPARRLEDADGRDLGPCPTCHPGRRR